MKPDSMPGSIGTSLRFLGLWGGGGRGVMEGGGEGGEGGGKSRGLFARLILYEGGAQDRAQGGEAVMGG